MFVNEPLRRDLQHAPPHDVLPLCLLDDILTTDLFNAEQMAAEFVQTGGLAVSATECGLVQLERRVTVNNMLALWQLVANSSCAAGDAEIGEIDVQHTKLSLVGSQCAVRMEFLGKGPSVEEVLGRSHAPMLDKRLTPSSTQHSACLRSGLAAWNVSHCMQEE